MSLSPLGAALGMHAETLVPASSRSFASLACRLNGTEPAAEAAAQEVFERCMAPSLDGALSVTDQPIEVSPLIRPHRARPGHAERFEASLRGMEVANGYSEFNDPNTQLTAFATQAPRYSAIYVDSIEALRFGLAPTRCVDIGVDRLLVVCTGARSIRDVIAFPTMRPLPANSKARVGPSSIASWR